MSGNPYVPDAATRAHEKAASKEARSARQDFVAGLSKITADMEAKLAVAGITVDDEPEPDMTGIPVVDYGRRVEMTTVMPVNIAAVQAISEIYASEAALINNTVLYAEGASAGTCCLWGLSLPRTYSVTS